MAPNHVNFFNLNNLSRFLKRHNFHIMDYYIHKIPLSPLLLIKRLFFKRDWATADPPILVSHSVRIPRYADNHIAFLKYENSGTVDENSSLRVRLSRSVGNIAQSLGATWRDHMIVLAKEV